MRIIKPEKNIMGIGGWVATIAALLLGCFIVMSFVVIIVSSLYIADINRGELLHYTGTPVEVKTDSGNHLSKSFSDADVRLQLDNGDWLETEYLVLAKNGIERTAEIREGVWEIYYTQYRTGWTHWGSDTKYHVLVSIAPEGYNEQMAAAAKRTQGTAIMLAVFAIPLLTLGCIFCSFPIMMQLRMCFETKKEQERREKKERRSAERRAKYLEERARIRAEKKKDS